MAAQGCVCVCEHLLLVAQHVELDIESLAGLEEVGQGRGHTSAVSTTLALHNLPSHQRL